MRDIKKRLAEVQDRIDAEKSLAIRLFLAAKKKGMENVMAGFTGEEGSNLYWAGNGMVMRIYEEHQMYTLKGYQQLMLQWNTVQYSIRRHIVEQVTLEEFGMRQRNIPAIPESNQGNN